MSKTPEILSNAGTESALPIDPKALGPARIQMALVLRGEGKAVDQLNAARAVLRKLPSRTEDRSSLHKLWGNLYEQRGLYPEAVEECRAAQLIAGQDAGASAMPLEPSSLPASDDLEAWKELAASLKKNTDAHREELRSRITASPVDVDD